AWPWLRPMQQAHLTAPAALLRTIDARGHFIDVTAISNDHSFIVSGDRAGFVAVWETSTGRELARLRQFDSSIVGLAVVDDKTIVVATERGSVLLIDLSLETAMASTTARIGISA